MDDEDDLLYGDSDVQDITASWSDGQKDTKTPSVAPTSEDTTAAADIKPTYWVILVRDTGVLEVGGTAKTTGKCESVIFIAYAHMAMRTPLCSCENSTCMGS